MDYYQKWIGGTGFYINGYTNQAYSNKSLLKLLQVLQLNNLEIEVLSLDEKEVLYTRVKDYDGEIEMHVCKNHLLVQ